MKKTTPLEISFVAIIVLIVGSFAWHQYRRATAVPHLGETMRQFCSHGKSMKEEGWVAVQFGEFVAGAEFSDNEAIAISYMRGDLSTVEDYGNWPALSGEEVERFLQANANGFEWKTNPFSVCEWYRQDGASTAEYLYGNLHIKGPEMLDEEMAARVEELRTALREDLPTQ